MALITEPKGSSAIPATRTPTSRAEVIMGTPAKSTARVDALKQKLMNQPTNSAPVAPRPAGSTARAEQYAKLQNQAGVTAPQQTTHTQPMQNVEPPPVSMTPSAEQGVSQIDNSVETTEVTSEATDKPLSPQFVALAKQERQLRKARQELKVQQDAWKTQQASYVSKDALLSDPLKALAEAGISYDRLTELQLSQIAPDPNQQLLDKIAALEAKLAGVDEQFVKRDNAAYDAAVNQIRNDVKLLVDSDPSFETIKATGESEAVVELIRRVFDAEGTILSVEEAANLVEEKLLQNKIDELERLSKLSKIKSRMAKQTENSAEVSTPQQPAQQTTLSNAGTVSRPLSARERAIMAFENAKTKV